MHGIALYSHATKRGAAQNSYLIYHTSYAFIKNKAISILSFFASLHANLIDTCFISRQILGTEAWS